jgi:hypothetical protein
LERARGYARAVDCLTAAAAADRKHLGVFGSDITVEVYFDPGSPQDAYLLIREEKGVILAFRGTLTPPLSPSSPYLVGAVADAVAKYNLAVAEAVKSFVVDWLDNIKAIPTPIGRHSGFDAAWQRLLNHLSQDCRTSPASVVAEGGCSRFLEFVEETNHGNWDRRFFVTGHSKGGAIATLAALDLPKVVGPGTTIVTYTFEAPKSLTLDFVSSPAAASVRDQLRGIWRFEYKNDLVPLVPLDRSSRALPLFLLLATSLKAYTHVGSVVFLQTNKVPITSDRVIDELPRLKEFFADFVNVDTAELAKMPGKWFGPDHWWTMIGDRLRDVGAAHCRQLIDNHFAVFAAIQEIVWAEKGKQKARSFFAVGIPDQSGTVMWGYRQWCDHLDLH